ncbi:hypothetical protein TKK_0011510 [Trichogramma kaykai]
MGWNLSHMNLKHKYCRDIYNWKFISMLLILSEVVSLSQEPSTLRKLLHPVAQIIIAVMKLKSGQKFYPVTFYCIQMLIKMCENSGVYLPVLPLLTEVLEKFNFNRRVTQILYGLLYHHG